MDEIVAALASAMSKKFSFDLICSMLLTADL
jgi:hypothetical protein